jgi:hypothetical protein
VITFDRIAFGCLLEQDTAHSQVQRLIAPSANTSHSFNGDLQSPPGEGEPWDQERRELDTLEALYRCGFVVLAGRLGSLSLRSQVKKLSHGNRSSNTYNELSH